MNEFKFFRGYNVNRFNLINWDLDAINRINEINQINNNNWLNGNNTITVPNWLGNPYLTYPHFTYDAGTYMNPNINGTTGGFPLTGTLTTSGTSTAVYTTEANTLSTTGTAILTTTNSNTFFTSTFK